MDHETLHRMKLAQADHREILKSTAPNPAIDCSYDCEHHSNSEIDNDSANGINDWKKCNHSQSSDIFNNSTEKEDLAIDSKLLQNSNQTSSILREKLDYLGGPNPSSTSDHSDDCLLYTSPSPRDLSTSRMPSSA